MTIDRPIDPIEDKFWAYVHGELDEPAFEAWIYTAPDLDFVLGPENYLSLAESDFRDVSPRARWERIDNARRIVTQRFPRGCVCLSQPRNFGENLSCPGCSVETRAETLARRTPWIKLAWCRDCGTHWLIGIDTVDDYFDVHRLSAEAATNIVAHDRWPAEFDHRAHLWPDVEWLKAFGFDSLDTWRAANDPSRR